MFTETGTVTETATEVLQSVQFVINQDSKPTAAVMDISVWETFLSLLENIEDAVLIWERMKDWHNKEGWTRWEDFEASAVA